MVVVVDILRATTSICVAFAAGAEKIIPVTDLEDAREYKSKGFLLAGERGGIKLDFADYGNSPKELMNAGLKGKTLVYTTTNGTQAIEIAGQAEYLVLGAFTNIGVLTEWLNQQNKNVTILCAGWENSFSLEDTLFAGLLTELLFAKNFYIQNDAATASFELWEMHKNNFSTFIKKSKHFQRLEKLGEGASLDFAVSLNSTPVIPFLKNKVLININKNEKSV